MKVQSPESRVQCQTATDCGWQMPVASSTLDPRPSTVSAFTLIEMLVVISILGILAALTVPALKNLGKANAAMSASRQLLDGVGRARQLAIANHTTVYMVFVPTNFWNNPVYNTSAAYVAWWNGPPGPGLTFAQRSAATNLCDKQLSGYIYVAYGAVGDQPGQHAWRYLAPSQNLPEGAFIATWKFTPPGQPATVINDPTSAQAPFNVYGFATNAIPFPTEDSSKILLPFIAFNYLGQLTTDGQNPASRDEYIPLARGSVFPAMDPSSKALQLNSPSVTETPPDNSSSSAYNMVDVDPLTGRATLLFQKVQ